MRNPWDAPFFYEDVRNVFFVTSTQQPVRVRNYPDYGVGGLPGLTELMVIPPLVVEIDPRFEVPPRFWGDGGPIGPDPFAVNPAATRQFVTEDVNISRVLESNLSVKFGERLIGPGGSLNISGEIFGKR